MLADGLTILGTLRPDRSAPEPSQHWFGIVSCSDGRGGWGNTDQRGNRLDTTPERSPLSKRSSIYFPSSPCLPALTTGFSSLLQDRVSTDSVIFLGYLGTAGVVDRSNSSLGRASADLLPESSLYFFKWSQHSEELIHRQPKDTMAVFFRE